MNNNSKKQSIRQQVFDQLKINPDITLKELKVMFSDCPYNTIRTYFKQHTNISGNISLNIKNELIRIIKDYKQPASARVQAIREYNNLIKESPEKEGDDPLLKLLQTLEKES